MSKVKIEKQTENGIEFIKDVEFNPVPEIGKTIEVDKNLYIVKKIRQSTDCFILTVKDKKESGFDGLHWL